MIYADFNSGMTTDGEIVAGLKEGAPQAFRALYASHGRAVLTFLVRMTGRREMAEELTQETFLRVIRKIGFFNARADGGLKAWVFRISTHLAIDALRREKRMIFFAEGEMEQIVSLASDAEASLEQSQFTADLQIALHELTEFQKTIFILKEQEGMSGLEISRVVGCSENAVKQGLYRAKTTLRKKLCEIQ